MRSSSATLDILNPQILGRARSNTGEVGYCGGWPGNGPRAARLRAGTCRSKATVRCSPLPRPRGHAAPASCGHTLPRRQSHVQQLRACRSRRCRDSLRAPSPTRVPSAAISQSRKYHHARLLSLVQTFSPSDYGFEGRVGQSRFGLNRAEAARTDEQGQRPSSPLRDSPSGGCRRTAAAQALSICPLCPLPLQAHDVKLLGAVGTMASLRLGDRRRTACSQQAPLLTGREGVGCGPDRRPRHGPNRYTRLHESFAPGEIWGSVDLEARHCVPLRT